MFAERALPAATHLSVAAGLTAAVLTLAATAHAQAAPRDSLPVHAGSYALEGDVGFNSSTFGAMRFLSPRAALGATITAGYSHQSGDNGTTTFSGTNLSVGYRHYGAFRDRIAGFGTVGVLGGYSHQHQSQSLSVGSYSSTSNSANVGGFGELGAAYLVARRLTVNGSAQASVTRLFSRSTNESTSGGFQSSRVHQNGYNASLGPVRLGLTLFL